MGIPDILTSRVDRPERDSDILPFTRAENAVVNLSIDSDASALTFEFVRHAVPRSKLTIKHNGTWLAGRVKVAVRHRDRDGSPRQDAFVTEWSSSTGDGYQAG
jgi:hypothetical protein